MNAKDIRWDHVTKSNKINDQLRDTKTSTEKIRSILQDIDTEIQSLVDSNKRNTTTIIELKQQVDDLTTDNVDLKETVKEHTKEIIQCPKCKQPPTGKYRDEMSIDGMYCRPCSVAWNVDWENMKPLYDTVIPITNE